MAIWRDDRHIVLAGGGFLFTIDPAERRWVSLRSTHPTGWFVGWVERSDTHRASSC
jgi:beta-lactamase class D